MSKKKLSLTLINSISIITFVIVMILGIFSWGYFSTQKVLNHNLEQYLKQTVNLTNIILNHEKKNLDEIAYKTTIILGSVDKEKESMQTVLSDSFVTQELDIIFLQTDEEIVDFSTSLFDTKRLIKSIKSNSLQEGSNTLLIKEEDNHYLILLSLKKVVNDKTGRVDGNLVVGKIVNDNFTLVSEIKRNASLEDIYIFSDDYILATSSMNLSLEIEDFKGKEIIQKDNSVYFNQSMKIDENSKINFVYIVNNSSLSLLKDDFIKAAYLLFVFVIVAFTTLYLFTNKFFIKPFSRLLNFANEAKENNLVVYDKTNILEFDEFALNLKDIIDELRELKEQYSRAIEGVQDGLWDIDLRTGNSYYSRRYLEMLGYNSLDEIKDIKNFWKRSVHQNDYKATLKKLSSHLKGDTKFYEDNYRFKCKDGSFRWLKIRGKIFLDIEGKPVRMTGFHTDIDDIIRLQKDNKKKEQMIYQQSKLASMGEMIGNIAHQWRQPLNVISTISSSQIIQIELGINEKTKTLEDLNKIVDTVQYLSTIIDKFRNFFNPNKELEVFDVEDIIKDNIEIFETSYKSHGIFLETKLEKIKIKGYKFELMQVIINLINNAKDAIQANTNIFENRKYIFLENYVQNENLIIKVYDNAGGIKNKIKDKIYEPYFTTKHKSQGTGLGLYMSSEIIKKHYEGELFNETKEYTYKGRKYKGEEFTIVIPIKNS